MNAGSHDTEVLWSFEKATCMRAGGQLLFQSFTWQVQSGETWAVVGPVASGKTTLAELLLGKHRLASGQLRWPAFEKPSSQQAVGWPAARIHHVTFREDSWRFSPRRHYYQQRFNFIEPQDDLSLDQFLSADLDVTEEQLDALTRRLRIADLRPLSLLKLSNGQIRRARIARALLKHPQILILDDPFLGLDVSGRAEVSSMLGELAGSGFHLLLLTSPGQLPAWVTHVLALDRFQIVSQGGRETYVPPLLPPGAEWLPLSSSSTSLENVSPIIDMRKVSVVYGERTILDDISWTVRTGERWAVLGSNGAGKSTLLSLICADHPQAYANDLSLFGRRRGTGETIWEIKQQIGLLSPELHAYFSEPLTTTQVVATGFFDMMVARPISREQSSRVEGLLADLGLTSLANRLFSQLSTGEQRMVLLARALIKSPPLLILDEPFQGLDERLAGQLRDWLDARLQPEQALLFVTHRSEEIPRSITHVLRLEGGRMVERR